MKITFFYIVISLLFLSCNSHVNGKEADQGMDSLPYPGTSLNGMSSQEFAYYNNRCTSFFDSLLISKEFNGSILVARNNTIVYEAYSGYTDPVEKKDTLVTNSAFHLASVSKTFTAMAILKLWEEGKLNLGDDLSTYFVDFPYTGVTVKSLLNHRSGLPNYLHYLEKYKWNKKKIATNEDILRSLYEMHPPLDFPTGKRFAYCNTNYVLLALIIEAVSGTPYGTFLQDNFFKPLQMNDTYVFTPADMPRALPSFQWNNRKYPYEFLDVVYGDKNIYSTARDLLKWDQALYADKLFAKQTLDSAFAPYSFEKEGRRNYGLGWRITLLDNGKKLLFHNGWWHGNNAVFIRLVDEKVVIIVLSNKFNRSVYSARNLCNLFGDYAVHGQVSE
ncbi:MAG: serine hydrolase domain-containing protein [Chitinophagaceae bacterium]